MAYVWLDTEGNGITVQETAADVHRKVEEEEGCYVALFREQEDGESWRTIYVYKDSIYAIEQGAGAGVEVR